ncbi:MAG: 16S rRNA (guanine(1207)-N(2))-methyltransferase RsmC, partial [Escherichia coli]|nr:16S rRNA (guanine(1207)-N(2))-methyltransferase RsmC [Escherichia coli]
RILFAGDLQDDLPARLDTAASRAHTQQFHHWQVLSRQMGDNARFSLVATADDVADCDTLIYYWPKNKPEAQFQLMNLLSLLPVGTDIFVVGENRSGVRSAEQMLADYAPLNKVDSARRCGLYFGRLEKQPVFDADKFWGEYSVDGLTVKTLPGVFSRDGLDVGSQLLLSTLTPHTKGKVLDVGCGAGVLSVAFARHSPKIRLTIRGAVRHLNSGGELRIVANAFLPYPDVLDETFGFHEVIAQTGRFKVYRAIMTRQAKKG